MKKNTWPNALMPYKNLIEETKKEGLRLIPKREATTLFQSKLGGFPYLPRDKEHPLDERGNPMFLLAQLNFEEIPPLEPYPTTGMLQFFVSYEDELIGVDFNDLVNQQNFRIIYHEQILTDVTQLVTDFSYVEKIKTYEDSEDNLPFHGEFSLTFEYNEEPITYADYRFWATFDGKIDFEQEINGEALIDIYAEHFSSTGHKIGGYPFFSQYDVRDQEGDYKEHQLLLLQIDTDIEQGIIWGDAGVANFFISEEALKKRNFTNVLYTWDCY